MQPLLKCPYQPLLLLNTIKLKVCAFGLEKQIMLKGQRLISCYFSAKISNIPFQPQFAWKRNSLLNAPLGALRTTGGKQRIRLVSNADLWVGQ